MTKRSYLPQIDFMI